MQHEGSFYLDEVRHLEEDAALALELSACGRLVKGYGDTRQNTTAQLLNILAQVTSAADVVADEPIWHNDKIVGFVTSSGYAHHAQKSIAIGFLPVELISEGRHVEIEILGDRRRATLLTKPLFDASGAHMRG